MVHSYEFHILNVFVILSLYEVHEQHYVKTKLAVYVI